MLTCAVVWFHFLYTFSSLLDFNILKFMLLLGVIKSQILIHNLKKQLLEEYIENKISPLVSFFFFFNTFVTSDVFVTEEMQTHSVGRHAEPRVGSAELLVSFYLKKNRPFKNKPFFKKSELLLCFSLS